MCPSIPKKCYNLAKETFSYFYNAKIIKMAFRKFELTKDDLDYHFIFCGRKYWSDAKMCTEELLNVFNLDSAILTILSMKKIHLVSKEAMEKYYNEEIEIDLKAMEFFDSFDRSVSENDDTHFKESVGDDLEIFFKNLQLAHLKQNSRTFYLPKISHSERKMIEERSIDRMHNYFSSEKHEQNLLSRLLDLSESKNFDKNDLLDQYKKLGTKAIEKVDVSKDEMDLSESNSKYIFCYCARRTDRLNFYPKTKKRKYS